MEIYKIQNLTFSYPDISSERDDVFLPPALTDVNLSFFGGDFVIVAGGSGSGKTTLLSQLKTCLRPRGRMSGNVYFEGHLLENADEREQAGKIGFVCQDAAAGFVTDKVWHELAFGLESLGFDNAAIKKRVAEMCSFFGLNDIFHKKVNELSGGEKQLVNLASVMAMSPEVLILDEPTSQLDPMAAMEFFNCLGRINKELGTTIIISEHRLEELWTMANHIVVMDGGAVVYDGRINDGIKSIYEKIDTVEAPTAAKIYFELNLKQDAISSEINTRVEDDLLENSKVYRADIPVTVTDGKKWLAEYDVNHSRTKMEASCEDDSDKEIALDIKDIFFKYEKDGNDVLSGLSLKIYKNEILAITGSNGCGKSTLLSLISGLEKPYRGKIKNPQNLKALCLPQDPKLLFTRATVHSELYGSSFNKKYNTETSRVGDAVDEIVKLCELEDLLRRHPYDLSGGEQQRLGLAKILINDPDIIMLDEPTKGMDALYKRKFGSILKELEKQGKTIILVSHDIEFCAEIADRMCLIFDGEVAACKKTKEYLAGNEFYTTAAARIAKGIIDDAVTVEDILQAYGIDEKKTDISSYGEENKIKKEKSGTNISDSPKTEGNKDNLAKSIEEREQNKISHFSKGRIFSLAVTAVIMCICFYKTVTQSDLTSLIENGAATETGIKYILIYILFIVSGICFILLLKPIGEAHNEEIELKKKNNTRNMVATIICFIAAIFTIWFGYTVLSDRKYYFISLLVLIEAMIPFILAFERKKLKARDIVTLAVMCAIGTAGRAVFFMIPNFNPVMAIVIITGTAFGCEIGFVTGAVTMLASNMIFGQGPWTPWQMFSLGLVGFFAGLIFNNSGVRSRSVTRLGLSVFGMLASILIYGAIMNPASVIMWQPSVNLSMIIAAYITGFPFDVVQGFATAVFLWIAARPFLEKLDRIKIKYGVLCSVQAKNDISDAQHEKQEEAVSGIPGVDMEKGLSYLAGDRDLYNEILETYASECDERICKLNQFKENHDIKSYEISIHGLKSSSATIGADEVSKMAANLEKICMDTGNAEKNIEIYHGDMLLKYRELTDDIKKWLDYNRKIGKIDKEKVFDLKNLLEIIVDMKTAIYEYREKDACQYLKELYNAETDAIKSSIGEEYFVALDGISKLVSDYDMNKAYESAEKLETNIRRLLE